MCFLTQHASDWSVGRFEICQRIFAPGVLVLIRRLARSVHRHFETEEADPRHLTAPRQQARTFCMLAPWIW